MSDDAQIAVMRSRIDQQAELIMLLKQSAEEQKTQNKELRLQLASLEPVLETKERELRESMICSEYFYIVFSALRICIVFSDR